VAEAEAWFGAWFGGVWVEVWAAFWACPVADAAFGDAWPDAETTSKGKSKYAGRLFIVIVLKLSTTYAKWPSDDLPKRFTTQFFLEKSFATDSTPSLTFPPRILVNHWLPAFAWDC
jgi:hypothetical protein